jgi:hypothetical protein
VKLAPIQIGSRKADPIAPRRAFGENGSEVFAVAITPVTPAASAVRRMAPTFTGLLMPCKMTRKGEIDCFSLKLASSSGGRVATKMIPCGVLV